MRIRSRLFDLIVAILLTAGLFGCGQEELIKPDFSGYKDVAELATLECYYHNVAEIYNPGDNMLFGKLNLNYKKAWFEYRGSITLGIDVNKVEISEPDGNGLVRISIPPAEIVGTPNVDDSSFSDIYSDTGLLAQITSDEQTEALAEAQRAMMEQASGDEDLKNQATNRAKTLLEEYVKNVGKAIGQDYSVEFTINESE